MNRYSPIAAALIIAAILVATLMPTAGTTTYAKNVIMAPEGGRLDALDAEGNILGPCALKHTDVDVSVSGHFTRVTVTQQYYNSYRDKIEAVYTFPLSHRAAVDRMTMTIGGRVVIGEVHERAEARAIYESARRQGYVASLLEQERPNIFTQSVANIEPAAEIKIEISYVEVLERKDGTYQFAFPMVVAPRYIPGSSQPSADTPEKKIAARLPGDLKPRHGLILLAPATLTVGSAGDVSTLGTLDDARLETLLSSATPIWAPQTNQRIELLESPSEPARPRAGQSRAGKSHTHQAQKLWYPFEAVYADGAKELGTLFTDRTGELNGRWFYINFKKPEPEKTDPLKVEVPATQPGAPFSPDTDQVPDASRITPMPVKPDQRAGHDISIHATIDTGGPGIVDLKSGLHKILRTETDKRDDGQPRKIKLQLKEAAEIPNRDFVLTWRQTADTIEEATFTHTGKHGNFFTLILQPPKRVADTQAVARELVFVLDSSGSMSGFPIEKAKEVMSKAIDALRPQDTFNLITFAGDTKILWDKPRPCTEANRTEAQGFLASRKGRGGTEMMKAINAALVQQQPDGPKPLTAQQLMNLPADGRTVRFTFGAKPGKYNPLVRDRNQTQTMPLSKWWGHYCRTARLIAGFKPMLEGKWTTENGQRVFVIDRLVDAGDTPTTPIRIVCFMTDGLVGNDMAIIDAVKRNAHTTRVFSFGIGNSVNRYLLDSMALAGRGEVEYVLLNEGADEKVKRFSERIRTPVLTDIGLEFSKNLTVTSRIPTHVPDLFDVKPLVIHGQYSKPGSGTLTIRGNTGSGPYERTVLLELPVSQPEHDTIATLWARARVEEIMNQDLQAAQQGNFPAELKTKIILLGEKFQIMTQFTSFVAVEKARITISGQPRLVPIPIEMPEGMDYEGVFGPDLDAMRKLVQKTEGKECAEKFDGVAARGMKMHRVLRGNDTHSYRSSGRGHAPSSRYLGRRSFSLTKDTNERRGGVVLSGISAGAAFGQPMWQHGFALQQPAAETPRTIQGPSKDRSRSELLNQSNASATMPPPSDERFLMVDDANDQATEIERTLGELVKQKVSTDKIRSVLRPEQLVLSVTQLVLAAKIDDARKLADGLVELYPDYMIGVQMRDVLADESLDAEARDKRIDELAEQVKKSLEPELRKAKLRRRLDPQLYEIATGNADTPLSECITATANGLRVTVLTRATDRTTIDSVTIDRATAQSLTKAGLKIESTADQLNLVVGTVPRDKLTDLALLDTVRKIELTQFQ